MMLPPNCTRQQSEYSHKYYRVTLGSVVLIPENDIDCAIFLPVYVFADRFIQLQTENRVLTTFHDGFDTLVWLDKWRRQSFRLESELVL